MPTTSTRITRRISAPYAPTIQAINSQDRAELFVEAQYKLARIFEDARDYPKAIEHYTEVLALDYNYQDARTRLDNLQKMG